MTKIPLNPAKLRVRRASVKYIVLHHTIESCNIPGVKIDSRKSQFNVLFNCVLEQKIPDINYHYVIEEVGVDYNVLVGRPISYLCDFPDIPDSINNRSIHIGILGSYDFKVPEVRMYNILSYRVLNPLLKEYGLAPNLVLFHRDISSDKKITCPGDFMTREKVVATIRRFVIK